MFIQAKSLTRNVIPVKVNCNEKIEIKEANKQRQAQLNKGLCERFIHFGEKQSCPEVCSRSFWYAKPFAGAKVIES